MSNPSTGRIRTSKKLGVLGLGSVSVAGVFLGLGTGTASADIEISAPEPYVTSRQALVIDENALRIADDGQARGTHLDTRWAESALVHAQGEVGGQPATVGEDRSATAIAVPGSYAIPFNLGRPGSHNGFQRQAAGQFLFTPPIGSFGGANG